MEHTREIQWTKKLINLSCILFLLVSTPLSANISYPVQTQSGTTVDAPNYLYVEPNSTDVYIQYDYEQAPLDEDTSVNILKYRRNQTTSLTDKIPDQFSSGTAFVDYYIAPLGPTYRFLDRDRRHQWQQFSLDYTFVDLDSSLSYKSTMLGWDFKAEAEGEVMDESSLSINWSRHF